MGLRRVDLLGRRRWPLGSVAGIGFLEHWIDQ